MAHTRCYRDGVLTAEDFSLDDVSVHLEDESAVVWVDLCSPDLQDLQLVADELGLHTLAVEDATIGRQRPKFNRYAGHDFLTAYRCSSFRTGWERQRPRSRRARRPRPRPSRE